MVTSLGPPVSLGASASPSLFQKRNAPCRVSSLTDSKRSIALTAGHNMTVGYTFDRKEKKDHGDGGWMVGTPLTDGMKVLLVDDVMTAGTAVREVIPKLKAEANVEVVGLVLSVDRMEKTKDSDMSAVKAVEAEFGFPVLSIANVREIFDAAAKMKNPDGTPLLSHDIQQRAAAYLEEYGA